jgi:hypothetical protein
MVLITLFLSLFMSCSQAAVSELQKAFNNKDYRSVSDTYRSNMQKNYSRQELIEISYSLRKLGFFRQDIKLNIRLVKKYYFNQHQSLMMAIKRGDTVNGDKYPEALKVLYWNLFTSYGEILKGYNEDSILVEKDNKSFVLFSKILSELEFREGKVDKYNDEIMNHRQYLTNKIYKFKTSWSVQYISWQQDATLKSNTGGEAGLIITNKGLCAGGELGYENYQFHFYLDGCVLYGTGNVKNNDQDLIDNYQQSSIPAYGIKAGPGASLIVSSSKSRIGIKLPMIYSVQKLTTPTQTGFSVEDGPSMAFIASLYSRWQFNKWYLQTEFGKYLKQEQTFWGLGIGKEF